MEINKVEQMNVRQITSKKCYMHLSKLHEPSSHAEVSSGSNLGT